MKAVLEYDLPDEHFEHRAAQAATGLACAIQEVDSRLRSMAKYEDKVSVNIETVRAMLREETEDCHWLWE
jgi:hypothetical protein